MTANVRLWHSTDRFLPTALSLIISFGFLLIVIFYLYGYLHRSTYSYSYYAPETLLGFAIGVACSIYEKRIRRRLIACLFVALLGFLGSGLFRVLLIYLLFIAASILCGFGVTNFKTSIIALTKSLRAIIAILFLIICFTLPLPSGGPAGTGFTEYKGTFFVVVFLPAISLFIFDSIVLRLSKRSLD